MELSFQKAKILRDEEGFWLGLNIKSMEKAQRFLYNMKPREYIATLKQKRKKRSLNANAYAWVLMTKIADAINTDKDEVYLEMLGRYGVYEQIVLKPEAVERFRQQWKNIQEKGTVTANGETGILVQYYFGSSGYDSKEMATLINGIVSECELLGIDTLTPNELSLMCQEWGK